LSIEEIITELQSRLFIAVEGHIVSDVPVGAFLSGGGLIQVQWFL